MVKVRKSFIIEVLLTTFHRQGQKLLGFWVFFMVLKLMLQLTLKQMMVLVHENPVIYGTNVWNRFDRGSLHNPLVHLFFCECSGKCALIFWIKPFSLSHHVIY